MYPAFHITHQDHCNGGSNDIMMTRIHSKPVTMWNLRRKHKVEICDLKGKVLKIMWLFKDGRNKLAIESEVDNQREILDRN